MRRHSPQLFRVPNDAPICDLNTTPLIDVMLVLLIMFIITVPIATHKVELALPTGPPRDEKPTIVHRLNQDAAGRLAFDGAPIREADLRARLTAMKADPQAELHFRTDATTRYEDFDRVLAAVKGAGITRLGLVGNDRYARFER